LGGPESRRPRVEGRSGTLHSGNLCAASARTDRLRGVAPGLHPHLRAHRISEAAATLIAGRGRRGR
jgi:hypothetical protein